MFKKILNFIYLTFTSGGIILAFYSTCTLWICIVNFIMDVYGCVQ